MRIWFCLNRDQNRNIEFTTRPKDGSYLNSTPDAANYSFKLLSAGFESFLAARGRHRGKNTWPS